MKTPVASLMSLRCKFKDMDTVEIVVIDNDTNDIFSLRWSFRKSKTQSKHSKDKVNMNVTLPEDKEISDLEIFKEED